MSDLPNSYNDILIDYCESILNIPTSENDKNKFYIYNPLSGGESYIILDNPANDYDNSSYSSIQSVNKNLLSNLNLISLTKEEIYTLITELSVDDLSFFSPSIEIFRKLPILQTNPAGVATRLSSDGYVYKKMDFIDGYLSYGLSGNVDGTDSLQSIFEGKSGTGMAAITQANWEIATATEALDGKTELLDTFTKTPTSVPKFEISFAFDSAQTFFGNNPKLIADFFINPLTAIQKLKTYNIESDDITRNYAYLMFFNEIQTGSKNNNRITPDTNNQPYTFLISIGYKPSDFNFDIIINDPTKRDRLKKFNSFLQQYGQYFNLYLKASLVNYNFEFAKDNSIKLKCEFVGNVDQNSLRDLYSLRRSDMDFMKVLQSLAAKDNNFISNHGAPSGEAVIKLMNTISALKKYINSCGNKADVERAEKYLEEAQLEYADYENYLLSYANTYSNFILTDVKLNQIIMNREQFAGPNNIRLDTWLNTVESPFEHDFDENLLLNLYNLNDKDFGDFATFVWDTTQSNSTSQTGVDGKYDTNSDDWGDTIDLSVSFFFFGDLINNIIKKFVQYQKDNGITKFNNMKVIFPNLKLRRRAVKTTGGITKMEGKRAKFLNLNAAYMPIPMDIWFEWTQKYLKDRTYYHLGDLLNDLKVLLNYSINYSNSNIVESNPLIKTLNNKKGTFYNYSTFYQSSFIVDKNQSSSFLNLGKSSLSNNRHSEFNTLNTKNDNPNYAFDSTKIKKPIYNDADQYDEYYIFGYTFNTMLIDDETSIHAQEDDGSTKKDTYVTSAGNIQLDMSLGIVHFFIGNQMGLAKSFKFNAGTTPYAVESQIEGASDVSLVGIKNVNINDVEIKIVGGNFFKPLDIIYVHPHHTFGDPFDQDYTISNILYIGGYYSVLKVNSSFSSKGVYETTITAKFLYAAQRGNKETCNVAIEDFEGIDKDVLEQIKIAIEGKNPVNKLAARFPILLLL